MNAAVASLSTRGKLQAEAIRQSLQSTSRKPSSVWRYRAVVDPVARVSSGTLDGA